MPRARARAPRQLSDPQETYLLTGDLLGETLEGAFGDWATAEAAWKLHRAAILAKHGTHGRPFGWWQFDAGPWLDDEGRRSRPGRYPRPVPADEQAILRGLHRQTQAEADFGAWWALESTGGLANATQEARQSIRYYRKEADAAGQGARLERLGEVLELCIAAMEAPIERDARNAIRWLEAAWKDNAAELETARRNFSAHYWHLSTWMRDYPRAARATLDLAQGKAQPRAPKVAVPPPEESESAEDPTASGRGQ